MSDSTVVVTVTKAVNKSMVPVQDDFATADVIRRRVTISRQQRREIIADRVSTTGSNGQEKRRRRNDLPLEETLAVRRPRVFFLSISIVDTVTPTLPTTSTVLFSKSSLGFQSRSVRRPDRYWILFFLSFFPLTVSQLVLGSRLDGSPPPTGR